MFMFHVVINYFLNYLKIKKYLYIFLNQPVDWNVTLKMKKKEQ